MQGYNSQMVIQPDMKLGIFATMSTGSSREGPFFTDTITAFAFGLLPKFYDYLVAQPQPSRLPPSPDDFVGVYGAEIGGGTTSMHSRPVPMNCVWPSGFASVRSVALALTSFFPWGGTGGAGRPCGAADWPQQQRGLR